MLLQILFFGVGLFFLLLGSRYLVRNSLILAGKIRVSPLVIGFTIVAIGTSIPEIAVTLFGGLDQATDLALGNIVGSNIANIGLVFGFALLFRGIKIGSLKTQKNTLFYFILSTVFFLALLFEKLQLLAGLFLLILGIATIVWQINEGKKGAFEEDKEVLDQLGKDGKHYLLAGLLFSLSLISLLAGSKLLVDSGVAIAHLLGISPFLIGIIAVSVGTSLPELAVTVISLLKKEEKLAVGNILGSNVYNILFGGGLLGVFDAKGVNNLAALLFFSVFSLVFCFLIYNFRGKRVSRYFGFLLLILFVIYLWTMLG